MKRQNQSIDVKEVKQIINENPSGFLDITFDKIREFKKAGTASIKYADVNIVKKDNTKQRLSLAWSATPIVFDVAYNSEYNSASLTFRKSSGVLGDVICSVYDEYKRQVQRAKDGGLISKKYQIRTIVQEEYKDEPAEDPLIRLKLGFGADGNALFDTYKIVNSNGNITQVPIKCTVDNVNSYLCSGTLTSGYVSIDSVAMGGFGITMPAKVTVLIIKPIQNKQPELSKFMTQGDIDAMACIEVSGNNDNDDADSECDDLGDGDRSMFAGY